MTDTTKQANIVWSTGEEYYVFDSLDDLIKYDDDIKAGDIVYYGEKGFLAPESFVKTKDVLNIIEERLYAYFGEGADGFAELVEGGAEQELNDLLKAWASKYLVPHFYGVENTKEYIVTEADIKGDEQ